MELPFPGQTLHRCASTGIELEPGAGHEIFDGSGDQDLIGPRLLGDSSPDVHGDSCLLSIDDFALAGMQADPEGQTEVLHDVSGFPREPKCSGRPVETREESIPGRVQLLAAVASQLTPDGRVVLTKNLEPS